MERIRVVDYKVGERVDVVVTSYFKQEGKYTITRSLISKNISQGVYVNGEFVKKSYKLHKDDIVEINIELFHSIFAEGIVSENALNNIVAEDGELNIVEEGDEWIVLNKPKGLVMHPGVGNTSGTLANYLRSYLEGKGEFDPLLERAGIVHRLDKGVSGLVIVAKTRETQLFLKNQFEEHKVFKIYQASIEKFMDTEFVKILNNWEVLKDIPEIISDVTSDTMEDWYRVGGYIRRDSVNRMRMLLGDVKSNGKRALSYIYPVVDKKELFINIRTGRMHQIRATLRKLGYVITGDELYGYKGKENIVGISLKSIFLGVNIGNGEYKEWRLI